MSATQDNTEAIHEMTNRLRSLEIELIKTNESMKSLNEKVGFLQKIIFTGTGAILLGVLGALISLVIKQ